MSSRVVISARNVKVNKLGTYGSLLCKYNDVATKNVREVVRPYFLRNRDIPASCTNWFDLEPKL